MEEDKISQTGMEKLEQRLGNQTEYGNLRPVQSEPKLVFRIHWLRVTCGKDSHCMTALTWRPEGRRKRETKNNMAETS